MPTITTTEQQFITSAEPVAQLTSALFDLLNDPAFDVLPDHAKDCAILSVLGIRTGLTHEDDALNPDTIDVEGIGRVRVSGLDLVGLNTSADGADHYRFEVIIRGLSRYWVTTKDGYTSLLTAMRGRP